MTMGNDDLSFNQVVVNDLAALATQLAAIQTALQSQPTTKPSTMPAIFIIPLPVANTEYRWQIPLGTKQFTMQCRDATDIRIATQMNIVATPNDPYMTMKAGTSMDFEGLDIQSLNNYLYLASAGTSKVVEVFVWS